MKKLVFFTLAATLFALAVIFTSLSLTSAYSYYDYSPSYYSSYNYYTPEFALFNPYDYDKIRIDGKLKTTYTSFDPFGGSKKTQVKLVYDNYKPFATTSYSPSYGYSSFGYYSPSSYYSYPSSYYSYSYPSSYDWYYSSPYYARDQNYDYRYRYY